MKVVVILTRRRLDKIKSDGQLAKIYDKWMKREVPAFPDSLPDIPFTVK